MNDHEKTRTEIEADAQEDLELEDKDADQVGGGWQKIDAASPAGPIPVPYPNLGR